MKTNHLRPAAWISSVLKEKCPNCDKSHVFESGTPLLNMPVMKEKCDACGYQYDREPGYFLGAMYISYGIAVFFGILTFLVMSFFFPQLPIIYTPVAIVLVILLLARKNYKLSRVIYMHMFPW